MSPPAETTGSDSAAHPTVLGRYADSWQRNAIDELIDLYATDVVAHYGGTSSYAGTHVGRDRFVEVLLETAIASGRTLVGIDLVLEEGDAGAIFARESVMVDGEPRVVARALRYRLADGLIAECWLYDQDQGVVDRSWGG
jgi:uncharacterized protein